MTTLPRMTEAEAYLYLDFVNFRMMGWEVADRMEHHHASRQAKAVTQRWMTILKNSPKADEFVAAAIAGAPVHLLWPEDLQVEVDRQINTKVPRVINEPTRAEFIKGMHEGGWTDWVLPKFLASHGREPEGAAE